MRNLAHPSVLPGSNTLLFDLGDPQASVRPDARQAASTVLPTADEAAKARLVSELRRTHPGATIPSPVAFHMTRHSRDPLSYGASFACALSTEG